MKENIIRWFCLCLAITGTTIYGQTITLKIRPVFGAEKLMLHKQQYVSDTGDSLYIDEFRFYISVIRFIKKGSTAYTEKESYHLIDAEDSTTWTLIIPAPENGCDALCFNIGVDSVSNVSGAMAGDLDPVKGMYWAWNTGYINARLSGHSPSCKTLHQVFEFHIGGYMSPYKTMRSVQLPLKKTSATLYLDADAAAWFQRVNLKTLNNIVMPSANAVKMADNYADMFRLVDLP